MKSLVETVVRRAGGIDALVNNAGIGQIKPLLEVTREETINVDGGNVMG